MYCLCAHHHIQVIVLQLNLEYHVAYASFVRLDGTTFVPT